MRMLKMKNVLILVLAFMLVLSGCSTGTDDSKQGASDNEGAKNGDVVELVYARGKDTTKASVKIIEDFNNSHPNIHVTYREMPSDSGAQHDGYVTALNAKSSEIDVMDLDVVWPAEFAQAGYVLPLDRFIQQDGIDMSEYNPGAVSAANFNGQQWAMPKFIDAGMLFYRTDLVSEDEVPQTWDELTKMASEKKGEAGTKFGFLMQAKQYEGLVTNAVEYIAAYGGAFIDDKGNVVVNSPETIKGLSKLVEIANSDYVPSNINTFTEIESHTAFLEGQSPFIRNWPYLYNLANDKDQSKVAGKVGVAPLPAGDAGRAAALGGWMTAISKYTEHPKEAWEFVKYMTGPEGQKTSAIYGGLAPTLPALFEDKEILEANPHFKNEGFVKGLDAAVSRPVVPNYPEISDIIQIEVSKAMSKQITVEEAVKNMETKMKQALNK